MEDSGETQEELNSVKQHHGEDNVSGFTQDNKYHFVELSIIFKKYQYCS